MRPTRVTYWHEINCNLSGAMLSCWRFWWCSDYLDVVVPRLLGDQALAPAAWDDLFNDDEAYLHQIFILGIFSGLLSPEKRVGVGVGGSK